jgi:hypothetical protein
LLEPPAPQVVCELCDEIERLRAQPSPFVVKLPTCPYADTMMRVAWNTCCEVIATRIRAAGGTVEEEL